MQAVAECYESASNNNANNWNESQSICGYFNTELPNGPWYIIFREAVSSKLQAFSAHQLASLLHSLGKLPIHVPEPLPIGFGTPRWARPMAGSKPEEWEASLSAVADMFIQKYQTQHTSGRGSSAITNSSTSGLKHTSTQPERQSDNMQPAAVRSGGAGTTPRGISDVLSTSSSTADSSTTFSNYRQPCAQAEHPAAAQPDSMTLQMFIIGAASCKKWCMIRVDTEWLYSSDCMQQLDELLMQHAYDDLTVRIVHAMLMLKMSPPAATLQSFYDKTAGRLTSLFSIQQLHTMVRSLIFLGSTPDYDWLAALVVAVRAHVPELSSKELQGFTEGFRCFSANGHMQARWLRDAIAQLEEFILI